MKAGCTQGQSLEVGKTRPLMQHTGCNSLVLRQPCTMGRTPQSKSTLLLSQILAACCSPPSLKGHSQVKCMEGCCSCQTVSAFAHQQDHFLLLINHVSKLYNILRMVQDSSSLFFAEAFQIQPVENV